MLTLTLVTPQKKLLESAEIQDVYGPAHRGELQSLPGHAPLVTTLGTGVLKYNLKGSSKAESVAISWGYCQVSESGVTVMAEVAEMAHEIDVAAADKNRKEALEALGKVNYDEFEDQLRKFQQAEARIKATQTTH